VVSQGNSSLQLSQLVTSTWTSFLKGSVIVLIIAQGLPAFIACCAYLVSESPPPNGDAITSRVLLSVTPPHKPTLHVMPHI
jgi:hypothetical protein